MSNELFDEALINKVLFLLARKIEDELPVLMKEVYDGCKGEKAQSPTPIGLTPLPAESLSFTRFAYERIGTLKKHRRLRTAANYKTALNSLSRFLKMQDIPFRKLDPDRIAAYQGWLEAGNISLNTISCYMRCLRAIYNKAIEMGYTKQPAPFRGVYTKIAETSKRAMPAEYLRRLQALRLREDESPAFVRDLFLFCFFTRGMSFIDMAFLRKSQVRDGYILYKRHKTQQEIRIKLEPYIQEIISRYWSNPTVYIFPIITVTDSVAADIQYRSRECYYNRVLKKLGKRIRLDIPLSFYVARHTWASLAFQHKVELEIISKALGHTNTNTTLIYIKSIENDVAVNEANQGLIERIFT